MLHTKFQASEASGSEGEEHLGPWDLGLTKLGNGPSDNAAYQILSTQSSRKVQDCRTKPANFHFVLQKLLVF